MSLKETTVRITGVSPLLMSAPTTCNPFAEMTKQMKTYSSKKTKTEEDHLALMRLDWYARLYVNQDGKVQIPAECFEACLVDGAKKTRKGKDAAVGITCDEVSPLRYNGPADIDKLFADTRFVSVMRVRVDRKAVMRCRPIFHEWACDVRLLVNDEVLNMAHVEAIAATAGRLVGICDFRPRYGRFNVEFVS